MKPLTKRFLLLVFSLGIFYSVNAQSNLSKHIEDRIENKLGKDVLDNASYRCLYHYKQQAKNRETGEILVLVDTMVLELGGNISRYYDLNKSDRDSAMLLTSTTSTGNINRIVIHGRQQDMAEYKDVQGKLDMTSLKGESAQIYKNRPKQEMTIIDGSQLEMFKCIDLVPFQTWTITSDTLSVLDYNCQKAECNFRGRHWTAWFAMDIPINDGPWKLYGLPGLILKAETTDGIFAFEAIGLEKKNIPIVINKDTYTVATREQLAQLTTMKRKKRGVRHISGGTVNMGSTPNPIQYERIELE